MKLLKQSLGTRKSTIPSSLPWSNNRSRIRIDWKRKIFIESRQPAKYTESPRKCSSPRGLSPPQFSIEFISFTILVSSFPLAHSLKGVILYSSICSFIILVSSSSGLQAARPSLGGEVIYLSIFFFIILVSSLPLAYRRHAQALEAKLFI